MQKMTAELFEMFKSCVYERSDLHFPDKKRSFFEKRLRERLERSGREDYEAYYSYLMENQSEVDALVQSLTTNQTYFYRNGGQFRAFSDRVVPALVEAKNREVVRSWGEAAEAGDGRCGGAEGARPRHKAMSIRVWSAGCSTGEEAYSIAFTLLDSVKYPRAWELSVLATDISRDVLRTARAGVYGDESVRYMQADVRDRHMAPVQGGWKVRDEAVRLVNFRAANIKDVTRTGSSRTLNLVDADGSSSALNAYGLFDVIFCRNVMIYFDREGQQRLVGALYDCLRPGGYLFTGDSEPLHLFSHNFERARDSEALYYVKPGN